VWRKKRLHLLEVLNGQRFKEELTHGASGVFDN
jgi:hypothetical protein